MGLFSRDKPKHEDQKDMIIKLRDTEEMIQKKVGFLEKKIEQEEAQIRKHGRTNKRAALQALSRKKRYEKQIQQLDGTLCTIEFQREALEQATLNKEVVGSMQSASKVMNEVNKGISVDNIHKLMDEIQEQHETAQELTNAISSPVGGSASDVDEDDLMAELRLLETDNGTDALPRMPEAINDPLPAKKKDKKKKKEDEDMDQLQAWLA